uniref:Uncharacterized protein n=1 Tax=Tetranychus urticae TaxID=32264 RepID=T1L0J6_TETUR
MLWTISIQISSIISTIFGNQLNLNYLLMVEPIR